MSDVSFGFGLGFAAIAVILCIIGAGEVAWPFIVAAAVCILAGILLDAKHDMDRYDEDDFTDFDDDWKED